MIKEKDIERNTKFISENVLQVDNLYELWEDSEYTLKDIKKYDYILECDSGSLYKIKK